MSPELLDAIRAHAAECAPRECCGVVIIEKGRKRYVPCRNMADDGQFELHPADYAAAEDRGEIVKIVHSHVYEPAIPSMADRVSCEAHGVPWVIVNYPTGAWLEFQPEGYEAPLVGRPYVYGVLDCFTLARDYYKREMGIDLYVPVEWWAEGSAALFQHFSEAGFIEADGPVQPGDGLLMQFGGDAWHCGVYLGGDQFLHHFRDRLSSRDVYGPIYRQHTRKVLRYKGK
ncbi:C40 family peptidase [Brachymonas sp.]|uniref:C40 family peptidase n=1 Tax=Brachymonas sp. TaxID=1936292 RepID=UPI0035B08E1C